MNIKNFGKGLLILFLMMLIVQSAKSESLFVLGASQAFYSAEPKSLYGSVRARAVGDLVTIIMNEKVTFGDSLGYTAERSSNTTDNFSSMINKILPGKILNDEFNNFGGANKVNSQTGTQRSLSVTDSFTVQVVQLLPNGNLMIQGKKTLINANERMDLLVSGVVDPRWINDTGQVNSKNVANLQFAMAGKGSISRGSNEGILNRVIRYLF